MKRFTINNLIDDGLGEGGLILLFRDDLSEKLANLDEDFIASYINHEYLDGSNEYEEWHPDEDDADYEVLL